MPLIRLTVLLCVVACGSGRVITETGQPAREPSCLEASPVDLVVEGTGEHVVPVELSNACAGTAFLDDVSVRGGDGSLAVGRDFPTRVDADGGQEVLDLLLSAPAAGVYEAVLEVEVSDADLLSVPVRVQVAAPRLTASVGEVDFGDVPIGCTTSRTVRIQNQGDRPGTLLSVHLDGELPVSLVEPPASVTLAPGEDATVELVSEPLDGGSFSGLLVVRDETEQARVALPVLGRATGDTRQTDETTVGSAAMIDVLFTIDRSGCSDDINQGVADHIEQVLAAARAADADLHLAATVADDGCIVGETPFVDTTFSASAATEAFEAMIDASFDIAPYGANTERGFLLAEAALSDENLRTGGCNASWYREDAFLQIVHVSDEPEQSTLGVSAYLDFLDELTAGRPYMVHAVAGDVPGGCASAAPGFGYDEAVRATGGRFTSLCQQPEQFMKDVTDGLVLEPPTRLTLTHVPVPATLEVRADGALLPATDWVHDAVENQIQLAEGVELPINTVLTATYVPAPERCP